MESENTIVAWKEDNVLIMRTYTQENLNRICTTLARWIDEFDKRFLYEILKQNKKRRGGRDNIRPTLSYFEWYAKFGKHLEKLIIKHDQEKITKALVEIRHFLTFILAEFVENYFNDKEQYTYFVSNFRKKALELQREISEKTDYEAWAKYSASKNHIEKFAYDLVDILGTGRTAPLVVQLKTIIMFGLFYIHILPIFIREIFEGNIEYVPNH